MHDFRRLHVWVAARLLGVDVYRLSVVVTRSEQRLVTAQLRRSALSIAANIAEGCGKSSRLETLRYLEIASGSAAETEHHLVVAAEIGLLHDAAADELVARTVSVRRMLYRLIARLPA